MYTYIDDIQPMMKYCFLSASTIAAGRQAYVHARFLTTISSQRKTERKNREFETTTVTRTNTVDTATNSQ